MSTKFGKHPPMELLPRAVLPRGTCMCGSCLTVVNLGSYGHFLERSVCFTTGSTVGNDARKV